MIRLVTFINLKLHELTNRRLTSLLFFIINHNHITKYY